MSYVAPVEADDDRDAVLATLASAEAAIERLQEELAFTVNVRLGACRDENQRLSKEAARWRAVRAVLGHVMKEKDASGNWVWRLATDWQRAPIPMTRDEAADRLAGVSPPAPAAPQPETDYPAAYSAMNRLYKMLGPFDGDPVRASHAKDLTTIWDAVKAAEARLLLEAEPSPAPPESEKP